MLAVVGLLVAWTVLVLAPTPAHAAGDVVSSFDLDYDVHRDGSVDVTETIDYRFGSSTSHGIYRDILVRVPYAGDRLKDQLFRVSGVKVSSPTGASTGHQQSFVDGDNGTRYLRMKIGSASEYVDSHETYVIRYTIDGALRHIDDHSEFFYNATGLNWDATLRDVTATVTVPGGVADLTCYAGSYGSDDACSSKENRNGTAVFTQGYLSPGQGLTVVVATTAGAIEPGADQPRLERGSPLRLLSTTAGKVVTLGLGGLAAAGGILAFALPIRDRRFSDTAPGVVPPDAGGAAVQEDHLDHDTIPVAFAPPEGMSVAAAKLLHDKKIEPRGTAATLIDLAVRGAVRIHNTSDDDFDGEVELVDRGPLQFPEEHTFIDSLFAHKSIGQRVHITRGRSNALAKAHRGLVQVTRSQVRKAKWFQSMPGEERAARKHGKNWGVIAVLIFGSYTFLKSGASAISSSAVGWLVVPVVGIVVLVAGLIRRRRQARRTALGRATEDQIVGFRRYLATAEADQLRFEEGEDIFSRYLPWAIAFDLADRWQQVCAKAVQEGYVTMSAEPTWISGGYNPLYMNTATFASFTDTVSSSFTPVAPTSGSGGSSTGSGFSSGGGGGGGFSGGGSGGGGGGSW